MAGGFWRLMGRMNKRMMLRIYGPKFPGARVILLLTTTGRKSGLQRVTPLQYEKIDGVYYVASARGTNADWIRNLQSNPQVKVQVKDLCYTTQAELITDPQRIADFLELRLKRHPLMIGLLLRIEGLPLKIKRADLERLAQEKALVALRALPDGDA